MRWTMVRRGMSQERRQRSRSTEWARVSTSRLARPPSGPAKSSAGAWVDSLGGSASRPISSRTATRAAQASKLVSSYVAGPVPCPQHDASLPAQRQAGAKATRPGQKFATGMTSSLRALRGGTSMR